MDVEAWDAWTPSEIVSRLRGGDGAWAIAGGWAIDLFAGSEPREHTDLEVVTTRDGLDLFRTALPEIEWYAAHDGNLTPVSAAPGILIDTWQTWGWDTAARAWRVDVMREPWDGARWNYRRDPTIGMALTDAVHISGGGIPFLAPEIVLLFKAKHNRPKDQRDFRRALPLMSGQQARWLATALTLERPDHFWLDALRS